MRCVCCDKKLSDYEVTIKSTATGEYLDTCLDCLSTIEVDWESNNEYSQNEDDYEYTELEEYDEYK